NLVGRRLLDPEHVRLARPVPAEHETDDEKRCEHAASDDERALLRRPGLGPASEPTQHPGISSTASKTSTTSEPSLALSRELPQHVVQNASVHEVLLLLRRIDPDSCLELRSLAVR